MIRCSDDILTLQMKILRYVGSNGMPITGIVSTPIHTLCLLAMSVSEDLSYISAKLIRIHRKKTNLEIEGQVFKSKSLLCRLLVGSLDIVSDTLDGNIIGLCQTIIISRSLSSSMLVAASPKS